VALAVLSLAPRVQVHGGRAVEIALLHDLAEVRFGDLPRTAARYLPAGAKHAAERAAFAELAAPLGEHATALFDDYLAGHSREARFVRACDKLQLMMKVLVYERWGAGGLAEFWANPANFPDEAEFPALDGLVAELRARRCELDRRAAGL
jgi:putative hydrolase of HD superfamily